MVHLYLGLGTNLGDRIGNIKSAVALLNDRLQLQDSRLSSIYETKPWGVHDQPPFLNCVLYSLTNETPGSILREAKNIEHLIGRERENERRWGPRLIDIDILLYGDLCISDNELTVPHPYMTERKFVLIPLLELDPLCSCPMTNTPYFQFLLKLEPQGIYYFSLNRYSNV